MTLMTNDIRYNPCSGHLVDGSDAVRAYVLQSWTFLGATLHSVSSPPFVRIDELDTEVSLHYGHTEHATEMHGLKRSAMAYVNRYRHVDGRWLVACRRPDTPYSADIGALHDSYPGRETPWDVEVEHRDAILMRGWRDVRLAGGTGGGP